MILNAVENTIEADIPVRAPLTLTTIPNDAIEKILKFCDYKSIMCLRKTSRSLRNFITQTKDSSFEAIQILVSNERIGWGFIKTAYRQDIISTNYHRNGGNGCWLFYGKNPRKSNVILGADWMDLFFQDFEFFLRHQRAPLEVFRLAFGETNDATFERFEKMLKSIIKTPLKTLRLFFDGVGATRIAALIHVFNIPLVQVIENKHKLREPDRDTMKIRRAASFEKTTVFREICSFEDLPEGFRSLSLIRHRLDVLRWYDLQRFWALTIDSKYPVKKCELSFTSIESEEHILASLGLCAFDNWPSGRIWIYRALGRRDNYYVIIMLEPNFASLRLECYENDNDIDL